jgi:hypothetical protein
VANNIIKVLRESVAREWDEAKDCSALLGLISPGKYDRLVTRRKLQLFTSAVCRSLWRKLGREERETVAMVECLADGEGDEKRVRNLIARTSAFMYPGRMVHWMFPIRQHRPMADILPDFTGYAAACGVSGVAQADIMRGPLGNPYRPPYVCWKGATAKELKESGWGESRPVFPAHILNMARRCYEERLEDGSLDRARLMVLSDALEDEGMEGDILTHLREERVAWRGWWSLDYVLGKV